MDKCKKKKPYNSYNPVIIKRLREKYGLTVQFIMQSMRGERVSETSIKICEDYKKMEREINKVIKNQ